MINFLPPEQVEYLKREENLKIILHIFFFFLFFLFSLFLVLLILKINLSSNLEAQRIILEREKSLLDGETEKEIEKYNKLLARINSFYKERVSFSPIFEEISKLIPQDIFLQNLTIEYRKKREILVSLNGIANRRDDFLEILKAIREKYPEFSFSPESLLKEKNVEFSISFKIK